MVLSLMTASGSPRPSFRSKWTCRGRRLRGPSRRPVVGAEPHRDHGRRGDRPAGDLVGHLRRPRRAGCRSPPTSRWSRCSPARPGTPRSSSYCSTPISASMSAIADGAHATTPPSPQLGDPRRVQPGRGQQRVGVGPARVADHDRPGRAPPSRPAPGRPGGTGSGPLGRRSASITASTMASAGPELVVVDQLGHRQHRGHTGVGAGQLGHPGVAVPGGEGGPEVGPDLVLDLVVELVGRPTARSRGAGTGWRRTWARWPRPPASRRRRPGRCRSRRSGR